MKIAIMGSTAYREGRMLPLKVELEKAGHEVRLPTFDGGARTEYDLMSQNRALIEWADTICILWDGRSIGTWGDICMAFALRKPIALPYLEPTSCRNFVKQYLKRGPGPSNNNQNTSRP